jgi:hypothetical protein
LAEDDAEEAVMASMRAATSFEHCERMVAPAVGGAFLSSR